MIPDLLERADLVELMDDLDCNEAKLLHTIQQFASINRLVSRYKTILNRWILSDMMQRPDRQYHLLDMGAGGCDIDAWLLQEAGRRGLSLRITACDIDQRIIEYAHSVYGDVPELTICRKDLLSDSFDEPVDYIFANHFLHHLNNEDIIKLFRIWEPRVRCRMIFSDLLRSKSAWLGYGLLSLFYTGGFARTDGLISIQKGFLAEELLSLAEKAVVADADVCKLLPGRLVLSINMNGNNALSK